MFAFRAMTLTAVRQGLHIFGGQNGGQRPFDSFLGGVRYLGSGGGLVNDNGLGLPITLSGDEAFGGGGGRDHERVRSGEVLFSGHGVLLWQRLLLIRPDSGGLLHQHRVRQCRRRREPGRRHHRDGALQSPRDPRPLGPGLCCWLVQWSSITLPWSCT